MVHKLIQGGPRLRVRRATLRFEEKLRAAKRGTPLQLKDSFAVLTDLNFAARLTQVLILGQFFNFLFVCLRLKVQIFC